MAAPIQTLTLDVHYSIFRRAIQPALRTPVGGGASQFRRRYQRPVYEFSIHNSHCTRLDAQEFFGFVSYHGPDIPFWFSGNVWGLVDQARPALFGFGDGVRTQWFLPNRHITVGNWGIWINNVLLTSGVTLDEPSGLVTFAVPPGNQLSLKADYSCTYRVVFASESEVLLNEELMYQALQKMEGIVLREVVP